MKIVLVMLVTAIITAAICLLLARSVCPDENYERSENQKTTQAKPETFPEEETVEVVEYLPDTGGARI